MCLQPNVPNNDRGQVGLNVTVITKKNNILQNNGN